MISTKLFSVAVMLALLAMASTVAFAQQSPPSPPPPKNCIDGTQPPCLPPLYPPRVNP